MMKKIVLKKEKVCCGPLMLVNACCPLRQNDTDSLTPFTMQFPDILMKQEAARALAFLLKEISAGNEIVPVSGYRSKKEQADIYENSLAENGEAFTKKYVAQPDHSEHQTGLAIDLGLNQKDIDFIRPEFPYDGICGKFRQAAPDYGFIERYAADKEEITGISHEPWHFRYVGVPHSKIMAEKDFSLEEYTEYLKNCREDCRFLYRQPDGRKAEIFYVPVSEKDVVINVAEADVCQVSGNNVDGVTVTVWRMGSKK